MTTEKTEAPITPKALDGSEPKPQKVRKSTRMMAITEAEMKDAKRTRDQFKVALKRKVRFFYDIQRMRIQAGGRTLNRSKTAEIDLHPVDVKILGNRASELLITEKNALKDVEDQLKLIPMYDRLLDKKKYKGIGPTMAGVILSEFNIEFEDTASKMWAFAGLAPVVAMRCRHCHRVMNLDEEAAETHGKPIYVHAGKAPGECVLISEKNTEVDASHVYASGKAMRPTRGEKLPYNAFLRSKLCGVLGPVMLKVGSPWRKHYDDYKNRKLAQGWGINDAHRHAAAIRYMIKMLLLEIWREWRTVEGLAVREPYAVEFLGKTPHVGGTIENNRVAGGDAEASENAAEIEAAILDSGSDPL